MVSIGMRPNHLKYFAIQAIVAPMTLNGRNRLLRLIFVVALVVYTTLILLFIAVLSGYVGERTPELGEVARAAAAGAITTGAIGLTVTAFFLRLFRRTPSVSLFFVGLFFVLMTVDIVKLAQLILPVTDWSGWSIAVARVTVAGHISGTAAIFGAGLFAGGVRMQRHGVALLFALLVAAGLSATIPLDTSTLPPHLVYLEGMRASLRLTLFVLLGVSVLNYIYAAVDAEAWRRLWSAGAIALAAIGREILFYRVEPMWIVAGGVCALAGAVIYGLQNYREYVVS